MYVPTAPSLVERAAFFCAEAMPRLRSTTNASSMSPLASCRAFRQSPMGAPDFSRSSFTNLASIFSLTVVISRFPADGQPFSLFCFIRICAACRAAKEKRGKRPGGHACPQLRACARSKKSEYVFGRFVFVQRRHGRTRLAHGVAQSRLEF